MSNPGLTEASAQAGLYAHLYAILYLVTQINVYRAVTAGQTLTGFNVSRRRQISCVRLSTAVVLGEIMCILREVQCSTAVNRAIRGKCFQDKYHQDKIEAKTPEI